MGNKKNYKLDTDTANELLKNVFAKSGRETENFDVNNLKDEIRPYTARYRVAKITVGILIILTFLAPLFFPHPPIIMKTGTQGPEFFEMNSNYVINGNIYLSFVGEKLDCKKCIMSTDKSMLFIPTSFDEEKNLISFPYDENSFDENANIKLESENGSVVTLVITRRKKG